MKYRDCPLYSLKSKRRLCFLLNNTNKEYFKQDYVSSLIEPYFKTAGKPRLIKPSRNDLKAIQNRIKNALGKKIFPDNAFSGVKVRSYVDNAFFHMSTFH